MPRSGDAQNAPDDRIAATLVSGASELGWQLEARQVEMLLAYLSLLTAWNTVHNLSALRSSADSLTKNLLDSLSIVRPMAAYAGARPVHVLDVGAGAGLPAVTLAIMQPGWIITAVDAVAKKAAFVRQVVGELRLSNLRPRHSRAENLTGVRADIVTARAFGSLAQLVGASRHLLSPGGVWAAMKGHWPDAEVAALPSDIRVFHVEQLHVPGLDAERRLVWMRREENAE